MASRSFGGQSPAVSHLTRGHGGLSGEVADLRGDVETAFSALEGEVDSIARHIVVVQVTPAANVGAGGTTQVVGFSLLDEVGTPIHEQLLVGFGVFDDADLAVMAVNATLATATKGTILSAEGSHALAVKTDVNGEFACTITDAADEIVWLACYTSVGSPALDCRSKDSVTFSA